MGHDCRIEQIGTFAVFRLYFGQGTPRKTQRVILSVNGYDLLTGNGVHITPKLPHQ